MAASTLLALLAFLVTFSGSRALQCYNCTSDVTYGCADPFMMSNTTSIPTCAGTWCSKNTTYIGYLDLVVVSRWCEQSTPVPSGPCTALTSIGAAGIRVTTFACSCSSGDECNSAPGGLHQRMGVYASLATSAAVVMAAKLQG
jgi:hypothetical protein